MDTLPPISAQQTRLTALANMIATGGVLVGTKVHLFQNNISPTPQTVVSDFTEATFTGYVATATGTFGTPYIGIDGQAHATAPQIQFTATDAVSPNTIYGAYVTNTAGSVLIWSAVFVQPVPIPAASYAVLFEPDFIYND